MHFALMHFPSLNVFPVRKHVKHWSTDMICNSTRQPPWLLVSLMLGGVALAVNAVALLTGHVLNNIDLRTHYQWAAQFFSILAEGTLYPRWMPLANDGLGEPSFVIVHPGYYYIIALLQALGLDIWAAMRWAATASTFLLGLAAFWLLRRQLDHRIALASAGLMQTLPFAAFLFGFHAALPWQFSFPLAVLVIGLTTIRKRDRIDLLLALSVALLCVTHLLVTFMVLLCLTVMQGLTTLHHGANEIRASLIPWATSVSLGLGLSAVYWLLAATSLPLFVHIVSVDNPYLTYRNSFVFPFVTSGIYGTRWAVVQWIMPVVPLCFLLVTAWWLAGQWRRPSELWFATSRLWIVGTVAFLLSSELAYPLYVNVSFLRNIQWPYRFLTVSNIAGTLALALVAGESFRISGARLIRAAVIGCAVLSVTMFASVQYKQYVEGADPELGSKTMAGHIGQKGAEPVSAGPDWKRYLEEGGLRGYCQRAGLVCETRLAKSHHHVWNIASNTGGKAVLPLFAFPAWQVRLDGVLIPARTDAPTGLIAVQIPSGRHSVSVHWSPLWQERVGFALSVASFLVCAAIFEVRRRRNKCGAGSPDRA